MGDQRQRDRRVLHVLLEASFDVRERMAVRLPPCLPDAVGDGIEEFRPLPQVGDGEGEGHWFIWGVMRRRTLTPPLEPAH